MSSIYRFRPVEALLDRFHELEKQEIYFAPPSELNDPYDGAIEVQWSGDAILWKNLLNHYLLCLTQAMISAYISPDDSGLLNSAAMLPSDVVLPNNGAKLLYERARTQFFGDGDAGRIPKLLAARSRPIGRNELCMYLRVLHTHTLQMVKELMHGLALIHLPDGFDPRFSLADATARCCQLLEGLNKEEAAKPDRRLVGSKFAEITRFVCYEQSLRFHLDGGDAMAKRRALLAVAADFPAWYVTELTTLLYSEWFTACFVDDATNAAMWGVYGNSHKGVALKFRTVDTNGQPALILNRITGMSGGRGGTRTIRTNVPHVLEPVRYPSQFTKIDFFQSLARITVREARFWHYDEAGNQSPMSAAAGYDTQPWRDNYWKNLKLALTTKHEDWKHERERRIVLHDGFVDFRSNKDNRKLVYRFEDLEGVVFGGKTPVAQVLEIVRAIREKCRRCGRKNFEFMRAEYSPHDGKMTIIPMPLLKVD